MKADSSQTGTSLTADQAEVLAIVAPWLLEADAPQAYNTEQLRERLGVGSRKSVYSWIDANGITKYRGRGNQILISRRELVDYFLQKNKKNN